MNFINENKLHKVKKNCWIDCYLLHLNHQLTTMKWVLVLIQANKNYASVSKNN